MAMAILPTTSAEDEVGEDVGLMIDDDDIGDVAALSLFP
jgi:hypothetical protein